MAYIRAGAGKLSLLWSRNGESGGRTSNMMYTPVNLLDNANMQTVWDADANTDVTITTADAINDLDAFFSSLIQLCANGVYDEGRVKYTGRFFTSPPVKDVRAYGGDDIEPEEIEKPKSEGEQVIDLKGGGKNG